MESVYKSVVGNGCKRPPETWLRVWNLNLGSPSHEVGMLSSIMLFFPLMLPNPSNWTESLTHWLLGVFFLYRLLYDCFLANCRSCVTLLTRRFWVKGWSGLLAQNILGEVMSYSLSVPEYVGWTDELQSVLAQDMLGKVMSYSVLAQDRISWGKLSYTLQA